MIPLIQLLHLQFESLLRVRMLSKNDYPQTKIHTGSTDKGERQTFDQ